MFIVIELWPEKSEAYIMADDNGKNYLFESADAAVEFAQKEAQDGLVVELRHHQ